MHPIVIAKYPRILLFIFFETIKGAAKTVPNKTLIICKIVIEFNSVPKKISHYLAFFLKVNTFLFLFNFYKNNEDFSLNI
jgi:hypothetical protein